MKLLRIGTIVAAALGIAACTSGVRMTQQEISPSYKSGEFAYAGADRDMEVIVVGNPFSGDHAAFGKAVTDHMQGNHWGPPTRFTTTPGPSARDIYRVVMLFDPPKTLTGMRLCRDEAASLPTESVGGEIVVFAAFCRGSKSLTEIKGRIEAADGASDPFFGDLIAQVTNALFPPDRRFDDDRGGCPPWLKCN
jgi:hypothetical protein